MNRSGQADLPLHHGRVPRWLAERMSTLGGAIIQAVAEDYGKAEVVKRLADPFWFQALGCVLGMHCQPYVEQERRDSWKYGGKTVFGDAQPPKDDSGQLELF